MNFTLVIDALELPLDARVDQRVPKKLFLDQGAPTTADKRQIQDGIEEIHWIAALKPTNIGVAAYRDETREYLEIVVLTVALRIAAKANRITELIHRTIPYPVVLLAGQGETVCLSLVHKRASQAEDGKVVIEEMYRTVPFRPEALETSENQFLASLALSSLPARDLFSLYQGWINRMMALEAARITGSFVSSDSADQSEALRDDLKTHARLQKELTMLSAKAAKERQVNRRVELNLQIKRLEGELAVVMKALREETQ